MDALLVGYCTVLGLCVGSFLNVVIWRVPRKLSLVSPPSQCPGCEQPIRPADNIPVVSYVLLKGRCRRCGTSIAMRYPLVELACGGLFAAAAIRFDWSWELPAYLFLFASLLAISIIDLEHQLIHNRVLLPVTLTGGALLGMAAAGEEDGSAYVRALLAGAVAFLLMFMIALASPKGMGMGDVKFSFVLGMHLGWIGWGEMFGGFFVSFLLGAVIGVALIATKIRTRKDAVPFGPFLALGTVITVLWGESLFSWYGVG